MIHHREGRGNTLPMEDMKEEMNKIIFLHGFFASGSCIPALALKEELQGETNVLTPDLSIHPQKAMEQIRTLCETERPDLLVGNSCGSFYAQMLSSELLIPALLGNPHFRMTEFLKIRIGAHQFKSPRKDGNQAFVIDEPLIKEFAQYEASQFNNIDQNMKDKVWGIFGDNDSVAHYETEFLKHYIISHHFPGAHTPNAEEVKKYHIPLIKEMLGKIKN